MYNALTYSYVNAMMNPSTISRRKKMGEIKQTNFRINADTADAFRKFCEEQGFNQAQGFDHLMQVLAIDQAKSLTPERKTEIEEFECSVKAILAAYLHSLEINANAEKRVKEQFTADLARRDRTIDELMKKIDALQTDKEVAEKAQAEAITVKETAEKNEKIAIEQAESAKKNSADQERIITMLNAKLAESEEKLSGYANLTIAEETARKKVQELTQSLNDCKKDHAAEIRALKKDAEIEQERAITAKERDMAAQIQAAELKAATLVGKLEMMEKQIQELSYPKTKTVTKKNNT